MLCKASYATCIMSVTYTRELMSIPFASIYFVRAVNHSTSRKVVCSPATYILHLSLVIVSLSFSLSREF